MYTSHEIQLPVVNNIPHHAFETNGESGAEPPDMRRAEEQLVADYRKFLMDVAVVQGIPDRVLIADLPPEQQEALNKWDAYRLRGDTANYHLAKRAGMSDDDIRVVKSGVSREFQERAKQDAIEKLITDYRQFRADAAAVRTMPTEGLLSDLTPEQQAILSRWDAYRTRTDSDNNHAARKSGLSDEEIWTVKKRVDDEYPG